jgi:RimJ/RimL family protein N-acetyltransferase
VKGPGDSLVTERLSLRRLTRDDLDLLHRLNSDPQVMRYLGGPMDRARSEAMLNDRILGYYARHPGLGIWATLERSSGQCIGIHVLNHIQGETFIQVGFVLFPQHWGRGYATEMAVALLRYGFTELALPLIVAITDLPNAESQRVLIKAGLRRQGERTFAHPAYAAQGPFAWFERDADSWLADHGAAG